MVSLGHLCGDYLFLLDKPLFQLVYIFDMIPLFGLNVHNLIEMCFLCFFIHDYIPTLYNLSVSKMSRVLVLIFGNMTNISTCLCCVPMSIFVLLWPKKPAIPGILLLFHLLIIVCVLAQLVCLIFFLLFQDKIIILQMERCQLG